MAWISGTPSDGDFFVTGQTSSRQRLRKFSAGTSGINPVWHEYVVYVTTTVTTYEARGRASYGVPSGSTNLTDRHKTVGLTTFNFPDVAGTIVTYSSHRANEANGFTVVKTVQTLTPSIYEDGVETGFS